MIKKLTQTFFAITIALAANAQTASQYPGLAGSSKAKVAYLARCLQSPGISGNETYNQSSAIPSTHSSVPQSTLRNISEDVIGTTFYDVQTNSSANDRLNLNSDGTISATWTFCPDNSSSFAKRGTGYNYFNGTSWGGVPITRIETERTGFTNIAVSIDNQELVVAHNTDNEYLQLTSRPVKGTGAWTESATAFQTTAQGGCLWAKTAVGGPDGKTIHVIALTAPEATGFTGAPYLGVNGNLLYYRSTGMMKNLLMGDEITPKRPTPSGIIFSSSMSSLFRS